MIQLGTEGIEENFREILKKILMILTIIIVTILPWLPITDGLNWCTPKPCF